MSRPPAKKQGLSLNDVSQQVIALSSSSKDGLGPLLTGTLYEALSSTLVDIEEHPNTAQSMTKVVLVANQSESSASNSNVVEISVLFLSSVTTAGPTWPTTILLSRLLSYVEFDAKNIQVWSAAVKALLKVLAAKDLAPSRMCVPSASILFLSSWPPY